MTVNRWTCVVLRWLTMWFSALCVTLIRPWKSSVFCIVVVRCVGVCLIVNCSCFQRFARPSCSLWVKTLRGRDVSGLDALSAKARHQGHLGFPRLCCNGRSFLALTVGRVDLLSDRAGNIPGGSYVTQEILGMSGNSGSNRQNFLSYRQRLSRSVLSPRTTQVLKVWSP